jgi:hypothetical protein
MSASWQDDMLLAANNKRRAAGGSCAPVQPPGARQSSSMSPRWAPHSSDSDYLNQFGGNDVLYRNPHGEAYK